MPLRVDTGVGIATRITTTTTTVVKASPGKILRIVIGTAAAGAISVFDALVSTGTAICVLKASISEGSYALGFVCRTGITVKTEANTDLTVVYE